MVIVKSLFSGFHEFWTEQGLSHALVMNVLDEAPFSVLILTHDCCSSLQPFPLLIYFFSYITKHCSLQFLQQFCVIQSLIPSHQDPSQVLYDLRNQMITGLLSLCTAVGLAGCSSPSFAVLRAGDNDTSLGLQWGLQGVGRQPGTVCWQGLCQTITGWHSHKLISTQMSSLPPSHPRALGQWLTHGFGYSVVDSDHPLQLEVYSIALCHQKGTLITQQGVCQLENHSIPEWFVLEGDLKDHLIAPPATSRDIFH